MHVDVVKALFIGTIQNRASFFSAVQKLGSVHFITNGHGTGEFIGELVLLYSQAVKVLEHYATDEESEVEISHPYEFSKTVLSLQNRKELLSNQVNQLLKRLEEVAPLGTIPFHELDFFSSYKSVTPRLWVGPTAKMADRLDSSLIPLTKDGAREYFISFSTTPPSVAGLREIVMDEKLRKLGSDLSNTQAELAQVEHELKTRASWLTGLKEAFVKAMNSSTREYYEAQAKTPLNNRLFAIQGWVPETAMGPLLEVCVAHDIVVERIAPDDSEVKPSCLENKGIGRIGEDLVNIYDTPAYGDSDPSLWVLGFFSLFFAIIVGDSGYGLLFLLGALWIHFKKKPKEAFAKRIVALLALLGITCTGWGLLTQSFFGIEIEKDNPIHSLSIVDPLLKIHAKYHLDREDLVWQQWAATHKDTATPTVEDFLYSPTETGKAFAEVFKDHLFFEIALIVGVLHILVGMVRYMTRHKAYLGWILFLVGAYMYLPQLVGATSIVQCIVDSNPEEYAHHGASLMTVGFSLAVLFSLIQHGFKGILETVMTPVQLFSDVLSYLRLYALSMAGAIVAVLINGLDAGLPHAVSWLLIPICHAGNILIAVVGGVIHGLRLNFLEWYHYSFIGGGRRFIPLSLEQYI